MRKFLLSFLLTCLFAAGAIAQIADPPHWSTRNYITALQAGSLGTGQILLIGDSIFEELWWTQIPLDGHFVLNAAHGGAGIDDALATVQSFAPLARPHIAFVLIGINDCSVGSAPTVDYDAWQTKYETILQTIRANGGIPIAVTILPIELNKPLSQDFDQACRSRLNQEIIAAAAATGTLLLNANYYFGDPSTSYATALNGYTYDGVHPYGIGLTTEYYMLDDYVSAYW